MDRRALFSALPADALLLTRPASIRYVSGFTGSSAFILFSQKRDYFFTDKRYETQSQKEAGPSFAYVFYRTRPVEEICRILRSLRVRKLAAETDHAPYDFLKRIVDASGVRLVSGSDALLKQRSVKTAEELRLLKKALRIAEDSFSRVSGKIRPGAREDRIAFLLEQDMKRSGAEDMSFPVIIASGPRGALPHGQASCRRMRNNEFVVCDFGCRYRGYHSDITFTVNLKNRNSRLARAYAVAADCVELALGMIRPGASTRAVAEKVDHYIKKNGFKQGLIHSLGHGLGLDVHEYPNISANKDDPFLESMVFTIEPGIYLAGTGGVRIEKTVILHRKGPLVLNRERV